MSISEYFSWLTSSGETSATVGLVLTGIMVVVMLWGLFKGSRRGLFRQILHSIAVAASFIISYMTTTEMIAILDSELANLDMATLAPELVANGVIDEATAGIVMNVDNALVAEIMMLVVTVLLASIVFVLTYIVVSFLASIVYFIISRFIPKHRTAATLIPAMIIMAVGLLLYTEFWPFPEDMDAHNLESGMKNAYTMIGCLTGVAVVYVLERKFVDFTTEAVCWAQLLKIILGLGAVLLVKEGLRIPLEKVIGDPLPARAVRYFLIVLVAGFVWPMSFRWFSKLGRKNA